ncbi:hypothetical protein V8C34DRAFT_293530 [Trichoderma compactum]
MLWHPIWIHTSGVLKQPSAQPDETNAPTVSPARAVFLFVFHDWQFIVKVGVHARQSSRLRQS